MILIRKGVCDRKTMMNLFIFFGLLLVVAAKITRPCVPLKDKVGLIIGQDYWSIKNYTSAFHEDNPRPFGLASYTALEGIQGHLTGLWSPINYGSGVEWAGGLKDAYPGSSLQLGLYLVDAEERVANGELDAEIDFLAEFLREFENPVYLRIGYEFDSRENSYDAPKYVAAFRRIVDRIRGQDTRSNRYSNANSNRFRSREAARASNVAFVWHTTAFEPRDKMSIMDWFPGDSYVDWCGISIFQQPYECKAEFTFEGCMTYAQNMAGFCKRKHIPLMIAESTPFGGIVTPEEAKKNPNAKNAAGFNGSTWAKWFSTVLHFIDRFDVKLWTYINCDWESQPIWQMHRAPGLHWGDTRLQTHTVVAESWREQVLRNKKFSWSTNVGELGLGVGSHEEITDGSSDQHAKKDEDKDVNTYAHISAKFCENEESAATKAYRLARESWVKRLWDWISTDNDEDVHGIKYYFTASDFAVLCISILAITVAAYGIFLYIHPSRRLARGGYQII